MRAALDRVRLLAPLPAFALAVWGWAAGLVQLQASGSSAALLVSTSCGLLAVAALVSWASQVQAQRA